MDIILLRTLTRKSTLGFGQYSEMSIQQIIDIHKQRYLIWIYYNNERVTFTEDILMDIHIYEQHRIAKPGKDPEIFKKVNSAISGSTFCRDEIKYFKMKSKNKKIQKNRLKRSLCSRKREYYKKSVLQAKNRR